MDYLINTVAVTFGATSLSPIALGLIVVGVVLTLVLLLKKDK